MFLESIPLSTSTLAPVNETLRLNCQLKFEETESQLSIAGEIAYCGFFWDGLYCWPQTKLGKTVQNPCPGLFNGVAYDSSKNVTKKCLEDGTWELANFSECKSIINNTFNDLEKDYSNVKETSKIFFFGYGISLIALVLALFIFLYFKELKCTRNKIHTNLIITYILIDILWIVNFQSPFSSDSMNCFLFVILNYFLTTSYFWMFVEGLYLYLLVMQTFSVDKIPLPFYNVLGWGLSATFMLIWAPIKYFYGKSDVAHKCKWVGEDKLDNIYIVPILIVLLMNIFFMCVIIYVLITKLKVSNSAESQQYRKATKAMLVLIPLLGANYWFLLVPPQEATAKLIVLNLRAFLYSTQGLFVAILYCFMNGEVKNSIKNHLERWKSLRSLYSKKHGPRPSGPTNKGSASSGSTLLNTTIGENDTLDSLNDIRTSLLKRGEQLKDFNDFNNSSKLRHNNLLQANLFNPE